MVEQELGIQSRWSSSDSWSQFFAKYDLNDVLDIITIVFKTLDKYDRERRTSYGRDFLETARRIFFEQNVHYTIDDLGGVHFLADKEFAHNRASTIASLAGSRYANSLNSFEAGMASLSEAPSNGKAAIRSTFAAIEGLFRLMFPDSPRLTAAEADKITPLLQAAFANDRIALGASSKMLSSFKDWVDAAHFYRHEPGSEEVAQPPIGVAIHLTSTGASHLRWLAEIDSFSP